MTIDISIDKGDLQRHGDFLFPPCTCGFIQNNTGFEKGKATLSKSGYIMVQTDESRDCGGGNCLGRG